METPIRGRCIKAVLTASKGDRPKKLTVTLSVALPDYVAELARLKAGMPYQLKGINPSGVNALASVEITLAIKKSTEAELVVTTTDCRFIEEMMDGEMSSLMDSSERYKEASKTYQLDEEWNLRFDDGQIDLFEKQYQKHVAEWKDEADPEFEKLVETLKAKYGEDCDLAEAYNDYKQHVAEQKGDQDAKGDSEA